MTQLLAYHSDPTLKADMLAELAEHRKMDQIIKGTYGIGSNGDFKGCAVGCSIHSLNRKRGTSYKYGDHAAYEKGFGIPRQLASLEDRIFENLAGGKHLKWPERFMKAINPGAELSLVMPKFMLWLLIDRKHGVIQCIDNHKDIVSAILGVADLYERLLSGETVAPSKWSKARNAAYAYTDAAADANAYAARSAAYAAAATYAVAVAYAAANANANVYAYAYADADAAVCAANAYAANANAYAANAYGYANAANDARQKHWVKMADKLIELLRAA